MIINNFFFAVYLDGNDMGAMDKNVSAILMDIEKMINSASTPT